MARRHSGQVVYTSNVWSFRSGSLTVMLFPYTGNFAPLLPLFTWVYRWVLVTYWGGLSSNGLTSHPGGSGNAPTYFYRIYPYILCGRLIKWRGSGRGEKSEREKGISLHFICLPSSFQVLPCRLLWL